MSCHSEDTEPVKGESLVLVGNPNVGKSVIFGALTGRYATVSNYPGTTVGVSRGTARLKGRSIGVIDSPGVNSLVPVSEDERVTRDILLNEDIGTVLQVLDSKNLRRGLLITIQLLEMGLPVTLALNMYDEAGERGIKLDIDELSRATGLNAIPTIATQKWNLDKIQNVFSLHKRAEGGVTYPEPVEEGIQDISALLPKANISARSISIMLLSGDETLDEWLEEKIGKRSLEKIKQITSGVQSIYPEPVGYIINRARLRKVDAILKRVISRETLKQGRLSAAIGRYSMHPVWGIPILLAVLFLMYEFVGVLGAGISVDFFQNVIFDGFLNPWVTRVVEYVLPSGIIHDLIVGPYGLVTMALTYAIAIVLPIVGFFFLFFSVLEDSGYLPRLAIMSDKIFKLLGLNGKAVLPMVLGLGCDTMATMTTRILETKKERVLVTLLLALGVPCSAQLGVILGMLGAVSLTATIVWAGVIILIMLIVGFIASRLVPGDTSDFIIEIPPVRLPMASNIVLKTLVRVQWYLKEALPLFVLGTLVLFLLDKTGALAFLEKAASPLIVDFLQLPAESTQAFIVGFLRRDYGAAGLFALQKKGLLDPTQVVVSLVTITLFVPCIANLFMIVKERGVRAAVWMSAFIFPFALLAGGVLNFVLRALKVPL
ncbi:MAG: ferrous iron transport protein B [Thermodesulfobacteriota bacterium]|nr:MAG: ferrous iron transport protein B [Thermodesulfobacteriota bacterium]